MTLKTDDLFLVNRGGNSFKTEYELIKQNILIGAGGATVSETPPSDPHEGEFWYHPGTDELSIWVTDEVTGVVTGVGVRGSGSGYNSSATNVETSGGSGSELTVDIQAGVGGTIVNPTVNQGGHGYKTGDIVFITGTGHGNASLSITSVNVVALGAWESIRGGYWNRTGTTLSPENAGDSVDIGSGSITLNATGIINAGIYASTSNRLLLDGGNSGSGYVDNAINGSVMTRLTTGGDFYIGGSMNPTQGGETPNIKLNSDGNAYVRTALKVGDVTTAVPNAVLHVTESGVPDILLDDRSLANRTLKIDHTDGVSGFYSRRGTDNGAFAFYGNNAATTTAFTYIDNTGNLLIGGTLPSDPTITLNADGSGAFTGKVTSASTEETDSDTTLVTKDYADGGSSPSAASAYVNFDGKTLAIRQQFNVTAVTSLGTGQWKMTYTNPLQNASYCLAGYGGINSPQTDGNLVSVGYKGPLTSEQMLTVADATFSTGWAVGVELQNPEIVSVIVFAN